MGIFNKLAGGKDPFEIPADISRSDLQKAVCLIGIFAIGSDGHFDRNEVIDLKNSMIGMSLFNGGIETILGQAERLFDKDRTRALSWACKVCTQVGWQETAFTLACSLVFSDGELDPDEAKFIVDLSGDLKLETSFVQAVANTYSSLYRQPQ